MKLSEIKILLKELQTIAFQLPDGSLVPANFHVTEIGKVSRNFIDCGGTLRKEETINFQLWNANDYNHRIHPKKLVDIIELSEKVLQLDDLEIEVEYQGNTIQKFNLDFDGNYFLLTNTHTDCLAKEKCGFAVEKIKTTLTGASCAPGSGCC